MHFMFPRSIQLSSGIIKRILLFMSMAVVAIGLILPTQFDYNYPPRPHEKTTSLMSFVTFHGSYFQKFYLFYTGQAK